MMQARRRWASILMSYSCTIACSHCCFGCRPNDRTPIIATEDAVRVLSDFHRLDRNIHIAGGEPFQNYERLIEIVRAAYAEGVSPHFIETNASWCVSDDLVRERFLDLKRHGILWMLISSDPYHLELIPVEDVWRGLRIAEDIFGAGTTMGYATQEVLQSRAAISRDQEQWRRFILNEPPKLVGRAYRTYEAMIPAKPLSQLQLETGWGRNPGNTCCAEWDPLWEIHVDPYGNVQTNCGVVLGNVHQRPVTDILVSWHELPVLREFAERGIAALLELAHPYGFVPKETYSQKCHLCMTLRTFLRNADPRFKEVFAPDEIYTVS